MIDDLFDKELILENDRLILRPIRETDVEDIFEVFSDSLVMKYYDILPFKDLKRAVEQVDLFINSQKEHKMVRWGIEFKENRKLIGTCGFHCINEECKKAEVGYELSRVYWNKGIMTDALQLIMKFIFSQTDVNRIEAFVEIPNIASQKLLEKIGFTKEGILRSYERCRGDLIDITIWGCLRSDGIF